MNLLLLGAQGMAGHVMYHYFIEQCPSWSVIAWGRAECEVGDSGQWKEKISALNKEKKIEYVINCIGVVKPVANADPVLAMEINALFPHKLAAHAKEIGAKVIHLSTDCWNDTDPYGRSKRAGELDYPEHLTLRTSIIGPELKQNGTGLFHWFMMQDGAASGFVNHIWDGMTTLQLAKVIRSVIEERPDASHILEVRTKEKMTKYELLECLRVTFGKQILLHKKETETIDKTNSNADILCDVPLKEQIKELKEWMEKHRELYGQYGV